MKICSVDGCVKEAPARGFCPMHYQRFRRFGDPLFRKPNYIPPKKPKVKCAVDTCIKHAACKGYCTSHYSKLMRYGSPTGGPRRCWSFEPKAICKADGCKREVHALGFCVAHHSRFKNGNDLSKPLRSWRASIGDRRFAGAEGYIAIVVPPGTPGAATPTKRSHAWRMFEHRYVMQCHLGRPLLECERVHHKNGDDNRLENLELWSTAQPYGQRVEDKLKWAAEITQLYAPKRQAWPERMRP